MQIKDEQPTVKRVNNIVLENRKSLTVSGVNDVDSFDEQTVMLYTDLGELIIHGQDLHMNQLDVETGDVSIEGTITSLSYQEENQRGQGGFMSKLFR